MVETFYQGARHELSGHKTGMMTLINLGIGVAFAASLTSSLGFSKLTSGGGERAVSTPFQI
jgi:cation transport ATPase